MRLRLAILFAAAMTTALAQSRPAPDLCTPPPSGVAPSLPAKILEGQGKIHFPITTSSAKAQEFFNQGVAQMHSFWAREAERSFLQAAALDPEAPMPHWGVAMVAAGDFRPRFQIDMLDNVQGRAANRRMPPRVAEAVKKALELSAVPGKATPLEKLYIASVAAHRDTTVKDPDDAYEQGLRAILATYPREVEAKSYLALHIMRGFVLPEKTPRLPGSMEAVTLLRELLAEVPDHPGVHHYVIHGWEGSPFAAEAHPSCKRYAELVTNIPHALHMPGHIYSQTGRWQDAVASFTAAADNERKYMAADALYGSGHHGHNVHYLATSYSFAGNLDKALEAGRSLLDYKENPREAAQVDSVYSTYRQGFFSIMRALVQAEKWDLLLDGATLPELQQPRQRAWRNWALALAQANKGNVGAARELAKAMEAALDDFREKTKLKTPEELEVARVELHGHIELAEGKIDAGLKTLAQASHKERRLRYTEPPYYPRPVAEYLGGAALRHGRTPVAQTAFREALEQYPASARAVAGLKEASRRDGKTAVTGF